jgi:hypothetical protein
MDGIEFTCFFGRQLCLFKGYNAKTSFDYLIENGAGMSVGHRIGLDHCESAIAHIRVKFGVQR